MENMSVMHSGAILLLIRDVNVIIDSCFFRIDSISVHLSIWKISQDISSKPESVMTRAALTCNLRWLPLYSF